VTLTLPQLLITSLLAIAQGAGTAGNAITDGVLLFGMDTNQTGLSAGSTYYASNTAGAISSTPGTVEVTIGQANSTTDLYFSPRYNQQLTEDQQDALGGTSGTPSATNKFVTNDDTSATAIADKVIRWNPSGAYPTGDASNLTGVALSKGSYTASGAIAQNDTVYVSAANTVKSLYPSAMGTGSAISTTATNFTANRSLPLSTNGKYLHITGGERDISNGIVGNVRTINAGETDLTAGGATNIYTTGNGVRGYDVKSIGTDKFLFIFQADTGGVASGIKVVVVTVSGDTITVGSVTTIETTGNLADLPSCAKLNTDKGIIFYRKDSDTDIYSQVLSVSGTTITTNTPVLVKVVNSTLTSQAVQLGTDSVALVYCNASDSTLYGRTVSVSSTTPTVNAEQTIVTVGSTGAFDIGLEYISSTKLLLTYSQNASTINDQVATIAISGSTMTKSSNLAIGSQRYTKYYGLFVISSSYALVLVAQGNTGSGVLHFLNISSTTPTSISTQTLSSGNSSNYMGYNITKISPWTYITNNGGSVVDGDFIVKLTPVSTARLGVAESAIVDTASGNILFRYLTQTLTGITLTAGSIYYTDDTGQPTVNSSLTAPTLGIAISTTKILLQ
jgi:hypothetical protein